MPARVHGDGARAAGPAPALSRARRARRPRARAARPGHAVSVQSHPHAHFGAQRHNHAERRDRVRRARARRRRGECRGKHRGRPLGHARFRAALADVALPELQADGHTRFLWYEPRPQGDGVVGARRRSANGLPDRGAMPREPARVCYDTPQPPVHAGQQWKRGSGHRVGHVEHKRI